MKNMITILEMRKEITIIILEIIHMIHKKVMIMKIKQEKNNYLEISATKV